MGVSMETAAGRLQRQGGPGSTQPELTSCVVTARPTQLFRRGAKQRKSQSGHSFSEFATSAAGAPRAQRTCPETAEPGRCRPSSRPSAQGPHPDCPGGEGRRRQGVPVSTPDQGHDVMRRTEHRRAWKRAGGDHLRPVSRAHQARG